MSCYITYVVSCYNICYITCVMSCCITYVLSCYNMCHVMLCYITYVI